jgi:hypothetical protein
LLSRLLSEERAPLRYLAEAGSSGMPAEAVCAGSGSLRMTSSWWVFARDKPPGLPRERGGPGVTHGPMGPAIGEAKQWRDVLSIRRGKRLCGDIPPFFARSPGYSHVLFTSPQRRRVRLEAHRPPLASGLVARRMRRGRWEVLPCESSPWLSP